MVARETFSLGAAGRAANQRLAWTASLLIVLAACAPSARPAVKIGLVAPFVGRYREIGEEVVYAVRLAVREANEAGGVHGYSIELMAYDDEGDPELAAEQARKLAIDPQVVGAVGHWLDATTLAAAPVYAASGITLLATTASPELDRAALRLWYTDAAYASAGGCPLPCDPAANLAWLKTRTSVNGPTVGPATWGLNLFPGLAGDLAEGVEAVVPAPLPGDSTDPDFARRYQAVASGAQARFLAVLAYDATRLLISAIGASIEAQGTPSRAAVAAALRRADYEGLSGHFSFDSEGNWPGARAWLYRWDKGELVRP